MDDGAIVVTGANSGIGRECTRALLEAGATVIAACRDVQRAQTELVSLASPRLSVMALDLGSLASVRAFAGAVAARAPLRALICNAGVQTVNVADRTADGFELTFGVNHLGHYLLIHRLIPLLRPQARIAIVASGTHDPAQRTGVPVPRWRGARALAEPDLETLEAEGPMRTGQRAYSTSKLCNILTAYAFAERLASASRPITVVAYDPGLTPGTGLARRYPAPLRAIFTRVLPLLVPLMRRFQHVQRADQAGDNLARLVLDPTLTGVTRRYFAGRDEIRSSDDSYDRPKIDELFVESARLVGLTPAEAGVGI